MRPLLAIVFGLLVAAGNDSALGQRNVEAYVGRPFGVAQITIQPMASDGHPTNGFHRFSITSADRRAFYPVFTSAGVGGRVRSLLGARPTRESSAVTAFFLFAGDAPFEVTVNTPSPQTIRVVPQDRRAGHQRLLRTWWRQYTVSAQQAIRKGDYPPLVETYLLTTLGRRLGLDPPLIGRLLDESQGSRASIGSESLLVLLNTESQRLDALRDALVGAAAAEPASLDIPREIEWQQPAIDAATIDAVVEPISMRVPEECFYIRFGSFDNYLWLRELMEEHGGDITRMATARGHDAMLNERLQDQLGLRESAMAKLLGGQVISDVALIGRDTYLQEGAAIGILFEAKTPLLQTDLMKQRREAVAKGTANGATMTTVKINDRDVSFASSPDNRLRSFYVSIDNYHLVSSSREVIRRFIETSQGDRPLGKLAEFRLARKTIPIDRDDTVFVYLSTPFFRGLMSPQYQIELRRRMRSISEMEVSRLAMLTARLEGLEDSPESLATAGLLPRRPASRPDGSEMDIASGQWRDSRRGSRGTFIPIPDLPVEKVTASEAEQFRQIAVFHRSQWNHMDPLLVSLKRFATEEEDLERIRVEAHMLPFDPGKYGMVTSILAAPSRMELQPSPDDIASIQLVVKGGPLRPSIDPHLLFVGLKDVEVPIDLKSSSLFRILMILRSAPAYLGAWPQLGLLDLLPLSLTGTPDANGYTQLPFGIWRRQTDSGFSVLSFHQPLLESTVPALGIQESDFRAQVRLRVGDLSSSKLRSWFNALNYQRTLETSEANARLFHTVTQQLGVPIDQSKQVAEELLGVRLICTLGGDFQVEENLGGGSYWVSTHWPGQADGDREFTSPLLEWFRGAEADVTMLPNRLIAYAQFDMHRQPKPAEAEMKLPLFNLFRDNPFKREPKQTESNEPDPLEELPPPE